MIELDIVQPVRDQKNNLRAVFENFSLGVFIIGTNGTIDFINTEAAGILGLDRIENMGGNSLYDIDSILNCGLEKALDQVLDGNRYRLKDHCCTNRQGRFMVINLYGSPYCNNEGEITGFLGVIEDVTESYNQKTALEEAVEELSILWQVSEALSSVSDLDHALKMILTAVTANQGLGFNRAFLFLVDETGEKLIGRVAVGPANPEEAGRIWAQLSAQPKTLTELLDEYRNANSGAGFSLESLITNLEIDLKEPSVFAEALNENRGINVFVSDQLSQQSTGILRQLNSYNIAVAPIISKGKKLGLIAADNQITGREVTDSEVQLLWTFANHTAMALERSKLYENIVDHATRLEEKNRQIAESQEQLLRIEKMSVIGELTASIAHELRNPLTVIGGFANLMLSSGRGDENSEYLNIIVSEAKRAESVLNQVLDFSKASRSENGLVDFGSLVQATHDLFRVRVKCNRKLPELKIDELKMPVWGNRDQLQHAVYQFIGLPMEEMTDDCAAGISVFTEDNYVKMNMEFNGSTEAKEQAENILKQIFDTTIGTQKLSIIVAGETIKYHGGNLGIMSGTESPPILYMELPLYEVQENG
jgi:PAS domain S-box-containing protein